MTSTAMSAPGLSLHERDRRFALAREVLETLECDALLVPPGPRGTPTDGYFSHDALNSLIVIPRAGDPVGFHRSPGLIGVHLVLEERGEERWIDEWHFGPDGGRLAKRLSSYLGPQRRIAVVGATRGTLLHPHGWVPHGLMEQLRAEIPNATWVEAWDELAVRWLVKSDEELDLFRFAAHLGELACEAMCRAAVVGATEGDLAAAVHDVIVRPGGELPYLILHTGIENLSWGAPTWLHTSQHPRVLCDGDVVLSELFPTWAGIEAQAQMCIALGDVHPDIDRAADIARAGYDAGLAGLRPGRTFGEVAREMTQPVLDAGAWHLTPQIHSLTPLALIGPVMQGDFPESLRQHVPTLELRNTSGTALGPHTEIKAGMTFQLESNAVLGSRRVNIGGNAIVTADGCIELNQIPTHLHRA